VRGQITFGTISENRPAILMEGDFTQNSLSFEGVASERLWLDCHRRRVLPQQPQVVSFQAANLGVVLVRPVYAFDL
jgi:hypothetical protein